MGSLFEEFQIQIQIQIKGQRSRVDQIGGSGGSSVQCCDVLCYAGRAEHGAGGDED